jgi:hypothetical protein
MPPGSDVVFSQAKKTPAELNLVTLSEVSEFILDVALPDVVGLVHEDEMVLVEEPPVTHPFYVRPDVLHEVMTANC